MGSSLRAIRGVSCSRGVNGTTVLGLPGMLLSYSTLARRLDEGDDLCTAHLIKEHANDTCSYVADHCADTASGIAGSYMVLYYCALGGSGVGFGLACVGALLGGLKGLELLRPGIPHRRASPSCGRRSHIPTSTWNCRCRVAVPGFLSPRMELRPHCISFARCKHFWPPRRTCIDASAVAPRQLSLALCYPLAACAEDEAKQVVAV